MKKLKKTPGGSREFQDMRVCQNLGQFYPTVGPSEVMAIFFDIGIGTNFKPLDVASELLGALLTIIAKIGVNTVSAGFEINQKLLKKRKMVKIGEKQLKGIT